MSNRFAAIILALGVGVAILVCAPHGFAQSKAVEGIISKLEAERPSFGGEEPINLRFSLTNTTNQTLNVLKWQTPLEGFTADILQVQVADKTVTYIGRLVKRGPPRPEDFVTIGPGQSVSAVVNIAEAYDITHAGDYKVQFRSSLFEVGRESPKVLAAKTDFQPKPIRSDVVAFKLLEGRKPKLPKPAPPTGAAAKTPAFENCNQSQQTDLKNALSAAQSYAGGAVKCLNSGDSARYKKWFGAYNATRFNTVKNNFGKIKDALDNKTITFNCKCTENYYAYVYPNDPYRIYLCKLFWSAPLKGTDSKAGTIIHEVSHFYVVAGTKDHVYGQAGCKNLANSDPNKAIGNADSHEYFAENQPAVECGVHLLVYAPMVIMLSVTTCWIWRRRRQRAA